MKLLGRLVLLFGAVVFLMVVGVVVPLRLHSTRVSAGEPIGEWPSESAIDTSVIQSSSQSSVVVSPPRQTPNYWQNFNPSFETNDGWYASSEQECLSFWSREAYEGQRSAQIIGRQQGHVCEWWSLARKLSTLSLAPGHYYYFSGRVRTDGFEPGSEAYISLVFFGPDEYYKRSDSIVVTTNTVGSGEENEWAEVTRVITVPSQADTARVECHLDGKGQVWFDYLFLGLDIALGLSKTAYPDPVAPGGFLTYTITYSNTGMEPAQNVEIRDFRDSDTHFVAATPMPVPPSDDEWRLGILATTTGSIVDIVTVDPDAQKNYLFNLARMTSVNQVSNFQPVELALLVSATTGVVGPDGCAICIQPPPNEESTLSPGTIPLSHQVHNCGAITTNVTVTVSPPPAWTVVPPVTLISNLPPSQTEQVVVQLNIPSGVPAGTEGAALWSAAAACGGASAGITDVIGVISRPGPLFLPMVAKRYYRPCSDEDPCGGQDRYEPNNTYCSTTTPLISGISIQAPLCSPADKSDYYYLDVMVAGSLKIWLTNVPSGTDYDLYLYYEAAPTQHVRRSANWGTADEYIEYNVPADKLGRYYVRVHAFSGSSSSSYTLRATYPVPTGNQHLVLNEYSADVSTHLSRNRHP